MQPGKSVIALLGILALASCNYYQSFERRGPLPVEKVTFETIRAELLKPCGCIRCHSGDDPKAGLDLSQYSEIMAMEAVVPGKPKESSIYNEIMAEKMPPGGPMPPHDMMHMLEKWIEDGAPEK